MTEKDDREQQKAELLWKYVEELKQTEDPNDVQFVAVTSGECAEVVGLMETAAEAYVLARGEAALHCRREAVRQRVQAAIADAALSTRRVVPAVAPAAPRSVTLPGWLTAPLTGRSTGWVVAVAALMALLWVAIPRPPAVIPMSHTAALAAMPKAVHGRLGAEQTRAFWAHLMRCEECMDLYQEALKAAREPQPTRQSRLPIDLGMGAMGPRAVVWSSTPGYLWVASAPGSR